MYRTGSLHNSIKGKTRINAKSVSAKAEIQGSRNKQIYRYHQEDGAGTSRIKRRFMYLTKTEARRVVRAMIKASKAKS